jgi:hypothetical protein
MTFQEIIKDAPHIVQRKLEQLKFLRERPDFHPEPSAFVHIQIVTDRLIPTGNANLIMAGIFHDIMKFDTVKENPKTGFPTSPGHDDEAFYLVMSNNPVRAFCVQNGADPDIVALICKNHMRFHQLGQMRPAKRDRQIQTWTDQGIFDMLQIFGAADNMLEDFDLNNIEKSFKFNRK